MVKSKKQLVFNSFKTLYNNANINHFLSLKQLNCNLNLPNTNNF